MAKNPFASSKVREKLRPAIGRGEICYRIAYSDFDHRLTKALRAWLHDSS